MKALLASALVAAGLQLPTLEAAAAPANITIEVDAREISRSLLHARLEIPAAPGEFVVWYPKWIPGVHAPAGPVQNLAGLRFETAKGETVSWRRDDVEMNRFHLIVPAGSDRVIAKLDYICNQPTVNSSGVDCFSNSLLAAINWNTILLYPENASIDEMTASLRLHLPPEWKFGTALATVPGAPAAGGLAPIEFAAQTLRHFVDSPLICGQHFRTIEITGKGTPPAFLHLTSEAPSAIAIDDKLISQYKKLVAEALALFGSARFETYHFLVVCSDRVPHNGLEHLASSFNCVEERDLVDEKKRKSWPAYLLPHEFVHSWCGKFRRPAAMMTTNFHTAEQTRLLWIYEGLTQYLGEVLTARSGLLTPPEYLPALANKIDHLMHTSGRQWRPLDDTAAASWLVRARSVSWGHLRRDQDYYNEGLVVWLEADALIRARTDGRKSLDDFCRKFFAADPKQQPVVLPYEFKEVIATLRELADVEWEKFFADRIEKPLEKLGLDFFAPNLGYRFQFAAKPSEYLTEREKERKIVSATASLGLIAAEDGAITNVVPGSPADGAGLAPGMTIAGVNSRKFNTQRFKDAIADSVSTRRVELLMVDGDTFRSIAIQYADGARYLELTRATDHPDVLTNILKPVVKEESEKRQP